MVKYEQPLNEKVRLFLRMELLVERFRYHLNSLEPADSIAALMVLQELYNLSSRIDLKSDVLKEMDRMGLTVRHVVNEEDVDEQDFILEQLNHHSTVLHQHHGQLGQHLRNHAFFNSLRQRSALPGGVNCFDVPALQFWSEKPKEERLEDLQRWVLPYEVTSDAIKFLLDVIRQYGKEQECVAKDGFFQRAFAARKPYQLMQIFLEEPITSYPEISAGKQRFSLRFVQLGQMRDRGQQIREDVHFRLKLCTF